MLSRREPETGELHASLVHSSHYLEGKTPSISPIGYLVSFSTITNLTQTKGRPRTVLVIKGWCLGFIKCVVKCLPEIHIQRIIELTGLYLFPLFSALIGVRIFPEPPRLHPSSCPAPSFTSLSPSLLCSPFCPQLSSGSVLIWVLCGPREAGANFLLSFLALDALEQGNSCSLSYRAQRRAGGVCYMMCLGAFYASQTFHLYGHVLGSSCFCP